MSVRRWLLAGAVLMACGSKSGPPKEVNAFVAGLDKVSSATGDAVSELLDFDLKKCCMTERAPKAVALTLPLLAAMKEVPRLDKVPEGLRECYDGVIPKLDTLETALRPVTSVGQNLPKDPDWRTNVRAASAISGAFYAQQTGAAVCELWKALRTCRQAAKDVGARMDSFDGLKPPSCY